VGFAWSNLCQTPSSEPPKFVLYVSMMLYIICGFCSCSFSGIPLSDSIRCQSLGRPYTPVLAESGSEKSKTMSHLVQESATKRKTDRPTHQRTVNCPVMLS
jgi:hypothetical protein